MTRQERNVDPRARAVPVEDRFRAPADKAQSPPALGAHNPELPR